LAAQREQWGQAMIGELDRLDGRARRWRFAVGCVVAAVVMPPWGRTLAILGAMMAVAASAAGLFFYIHVHYRLGTHVSTWAGAAILVLILVGYILGGGVLLRRPGVAVPGWPADCSSRRPGWRWAGSASIDGSTRWGGPTGGC
jgi:hypothetical protein